MHIRKANEVFDSRKKEYLSGLLTERTYIEFLKEMIAGEDSVYEWYNVRGEWITEFLKEDFNLAKEDYLFFENLFLSDQNFIVRKNSLFVLIKYFNEKAKTSINYCLENDKEFSRNLNMVIKAKKGKLLSTMVNNNTLSFFLNHIDIYRNPNMTEWYFPNPNVLLHNSNSLVILNRKSFNGNLYLQKKEVKLLKELDYTTFHKLKETNYSFFHWLSENAIILKEYRRKDHIFQLIVPKETLMTHFNRIQKFFKEKKSETIFKLFRDGKKHFLWIFLKNSNIVLGIICQKRDFYEENYKINPIYRGGK